MRWAAIVFLSGCSSILGIEDFKLGDAGGNEMVDASGYCLGPQGFEVCVPTKPMGPMDAQDINQMLAMSTGNGTGMGSSPLCAGMQPASWTAAGHAPACFVIKSSVTISAIVQVTGERPLVIFASDTITIRAPLDVASHSGQSGQSGPAANKPPCAAPIDGGNGSSTGGAAGGSFITKGGDGGASSGGVQPGRAQPLESPPMRLRGGCSGGRGIATAQGNQGGAAGVGGGAVYLVAGNRITIESFVNASGGAGGGGFNGAGGGGGGSGGMILLHAPIIDGNGGVLIANGGGGGGGGAQSLGGTGNEPSPQMPGFVAAGGSPGPGGGGPGGNGFAGTTQAMSGGNGQVGAAAAGGGGGGGASGYIRANISPSQVTTSPPVSVINP